MSSLSDGWAIRRNGSCLFTSEVNCGPTRAPFFACCPTGLACPSQYNVACCAPGTNCTDTLVSASTPSCSNATWDLFDNGGYFCCEKGSKAYDRSGSNVCSSNGDGVLKTDRELIRVRQGVDAATFVASSSSARPTSASALTPITLPLSSSTATSTSESSPAPAQDSSSSTPIGAIVGGIVGGIIALVLIALLAWFFLRRRKQDKTPELQGSYNGIQQEDYNGGHYIQQGHGGDIKYMYQADGQAVHEVSGASSMSGGYVRELPAHSMPVELAAVTAPKAGDR